MNTYKNSCLCLYFNLTVLCHITNKSVRTHSVLDVAVRICTQFSGLVPRDNTISSTQDTLPPPKESNKAAKGPTLTKGPVKGTGVKPTKGIYSFT